MSFNRTKTGAPARDFATFEHLKRRREGGRETSDNLVLVHRTCNRRREHGIKTHDAELARLRLTQIDVERAKERQRGNYF